MSTEKDKYYVAVKVLLRRDNELLITHDIFGAWDIPGGRIRKNEFEEPLENVISRKIKEELGSNIKYEVGAPIVFFRHERLESALNKKVRIFAVGYEGRYVSGNIKLGDHHDKFEWVDALKFKPETYFEGGWLRGVKEYQDILRNKK